MTHTRKLMRMSSHSYALVIPKEIVEKYGWRERQKMAITDKGRGEVVVKDAKRR
jgi:bifunctional DNA-binding transcriptional regulator/antitoxin component of YhaV-PrlF toxin-antitoxin module